MGGPTTVSRGPQESVDRLDSWKEIAAYLKRDVTTVQRWEKREGMPVHRHVHDRIGSVYAFRSELDAWSHSRRLSAVPEEPSIAATEVPPPSASPRSDVGRRPKLLLPLVAAALALLILVAAFWLYRTEYFWKDPLADARFQTLTDFGGLEQAAAISRDGKFVAFLSNRDGRMDVWVTQVGSGQFHNLTQGAVPELVNEEVRTVGFSPDGSLVTFWVRRQNGSSVPDVSVWSVPTLGGEPQFYLEDAVEYDWTADGSRLTFHTPGPGDPYFVSDGVRRTEARPLFAAPAGLHAHFPLWSRDGSYIYFVQGSVPDKLDIWRIRVQGGTPERITFHDSLVGYPVFLDDHTLAYLASDPDGSGPQIYSINLERRVPHRLTSGVDHYTSLAATSDRRRLVTTVARTKHTLWRLPLSDSPQRNSEPVPVMQSAGYSPRMGSDYVLFRSSDGSSESIHKLASGVSTQLWSGDAASLLGAPAISADGKHIAFAIHQRSQSLLYVMESDGSNTRLLNDALDLQGNPAWSPDGTAITIAAKDHGEPHLYRIPVNGEKPTMVTSEYALDPAWAPDGSYVVFSGADIGTNFSVSAITSTGAAQKLPLTSLPRGARHVVFLPGGKSLLVLMGEMQHKDIWSIDLATGAKRQLTNFSPDFEIRDFDLSPDGREIIVERQQRQSDIVLIDRR